MLFQEVMASKPDLGLPEAPIGHIHLGTVGSMRSTSQYCERFSPLRGAIVTLPLVLAFQLV